VSRALLATLVLLLGCGGEPAVEESEPPLGPACTLPEGMSGRPSTIADAVDLINALEKPLTLPCFLQSLERPFGVLGTSNTGSAQPPEGADSPRVFLIFGDLWLAVVVKGEGRRLLEFGERRSGPRSLKGELGFPISRKLSKAAPYTRIDEGTGTKCKQCHVSEDRDETIDYARAYISLIVDPPEGFELHRAALEQSWMGCDEAAEPDRCAMFESILGHGEVFDANFAE
jgi:hypothetical protein